jgi:hypothetical protein
MKDYYAPDWWYEPPVLLDDQEQDLFDLSRERVAEERCLAELERSACQITYLLNQRNL